MTDSNKNGTMVWYDFITGDIEKAKTFYTKLFGWEYETMDMGPAGKYDMIKVGDKTLGGFMEPKGPNAKTVPPHWTAYVDVSDAAETVKRAKRLGGTVPVGPVDIPDMGAFGVSVDKEQAGISFYSSSRPPEETADEQQMPNLKEFCWTECMVDDVESAKAYYGKLFDWAFDAMDAGEGKEYFVAMAGGSMAAGIMKKPAEQQGPSHWLSYVFVESLEDTIKKAESIGGKTLAPPFAIKMGRSAIIQDNQGAVIGLFGDPVTPE